MKVKTVKKHNPIAKMVKSIRPTVVANKKGKGSYLRHKLDKLINLEKMDQH